MLCMILVGMNRCLHASHGKDKGAISRDVAQTECVNLRVNQAFTASIRQSRPYLLSKIHRVTYGLLRLGTYLQCLRADLRSIMAASIWLLHRTTGRSLHVSDFVCTMLS